MDNLFAIFIGMAIINNFILSKFLGLCPFFGVSKKLSTAVSMGLAVAMVMIVASIASWVLYFRLLVPLGIQYMATVIFILVIASLVQILEITIRRTNISLYNAFGIYLPLITTNCAVLGITFINVRSGYGFLEMIVSALGAGVGFTLVLAIMSGIRERLDLADVPESFKGIPVAMLVAMLLGISFIAFGGMV
ncbi:MAG: RnfABCDGE type electron transport complex subunit A [Candidatus Thermoplasmatota archaeon]|nr:RnfABCDGE type electron transport complex subunit A [Candidatus Thermoplasmatota archaeon]